jgi:hypothetical protein
MPIVPVDRICKVRTYADRYEYLNWLDCICAGLCDMGNAW